MTGLEKKTDTQREGKRRSGKSVEGVNPGRISLVLGSLWGELCCNPLLSMQTWAEFNQILLVAGNHRG